MDCVSHLENYIMSTLQESAQINALKAELAEARKVIEECRNALAEELSAWDIEPPIYHVQQAYRSCVQWMDSSSKETL
jgi:flagellar biosynthesis component FlhA